MHRSIALTIPATLALSAILAAADSFDEKVDAELAQRKWPGLIRMDVGVTRRGTKIPCLITSDDLDLHTKKIRVLLIGGLDGSRDSVTETLDFVEWFYDKNAERNERKQFAVSAVPIANPDGWATGKGPGNLSGGKPMGGYPSGGNAYNSPTDPEAAYLWRWIGMFAPDFVVQVGPGKAVSNEERAAAYGADSLLRQLWKNAPSNVGPIPAFYFPVADKRLLEYVARVSETGRADGQPKLPSPTARRVLQRRLSRSATEVATQLSRRYGHDLKTVAYIPALALIGRLRLGELTRDKAHLKDVERIVAPYLEGTKSSLPGRVSGSNLSGHLVFGELARATGRKRYIELARSAADLGFDRGGRPKPSMPFHNEMSDAVFMGCPILVQAGRLSGETRYYDLALDHMRFMLKLNLRKDGLHRHSPLDETAWGRGNGFPALGLALCLTDLPRDHGGRDEMLAAFRNHLAALLHHQDATGMWHQVVDHTGSYREMSCTCMIAFAMIRGIRLQLLDESTYGPAVRKAWDAIRLRVAADGGLVDVCTGTGKQKSLRAYLDRTAILGVDPRGGAMALMVSTEMAKWEAESSRGSDRR